MSSSFASFSRFALTTCMTLGLFASLSACGSILPASPPAALLNLAAADVTDSAFLDDVFSILDAGANTDNPDSPVAPSAKAARWNQLKKTHADLAGKFEALKQLSPEERKAKMAAIAKEHPELMARFHANPHFNGHGPRPEGFWAQGPRPFDPAGLKEKNPELAKALEALKDSNPEERRAKFEELRKAHPDWFPAPGDFELPMGPPGFGPGFGPRPGFAPPGLPEQLKAKHPELAKALEALKDAKPEERRAKFEELRKAHPDWFPAPPAFAPPMGFHRPMMSSFGHGRPMGHWHHPQDPAAQPAE